VEQIFQPAYRGRPLIVLSNNDGCTVARSKEAKRIGIKMGAPLFMIRDLVRRHKVVVCSSNYALYGDMSDRFMQTLEELSPKVMPYSIDEVLYEVEITDFCCHFPRRTTNSISAHIFTATFFWQRFFRGSPSAHNKRSL